MVGAHVAWMQDEPLGFDDSQASAHNEIHRSASLNARVLPTRRRRRSIFRSPRDDLQIAQRGTRVYFAARFTKEKQFRAPQRRMISTPHATSSAIFRVNQAHFADFFTRARCIRGAHMTTDKPSRRTTTELRCDRVGLKSYRIFNHRRHARRPSKVAPQCGPSSQITQL
jgi:hypothetical protein